MEADGAGWRWVNGLLIPNFNMLIKKQVAQSNDGTYLTIPHLDLGENDVVYKFDSIRRSRFYVQVNPHGSASAPTEAFFYFIPPATIKTSYNGKRNFVFPLIFIGHSLALNSLSNHLKLLLNRLFIDMPTPFLTHWCNNRVHFFIFQEKIYKNIINYFI